MSDTRSPWRMPLGVLIVLIVIVLAGTVIALNACAARPSGPATPAQNDSVAGLTERHITLSDGRYITCVTWSDYSFTNEVGYSGLSCDWEGAVHADE